MRLVRIDRATGETREVAAASAYLDVMQLSAAPTGDKVAFVGSGPATPPRLVVYDAATDSCEVVARVGPETMTAGELSHPRPLSWPTSKGDTCHGLYWPPASARFAAKGPPPLIVHIHGGPTSHADAGYEPLTQFLTTRGYAVLAVNYRGSTAYGRAYMLKLRKAWGDVDVQDAVSGLRYAAKEGLADPARAVIMGGSAGGYTVLQTMVTHPEAFTAGISYYGIANQFTLVADTHKFEERYNDSLLGILPDDAALYRERSPLFHAHKIKRPVAVFQGEDDKVVPKEQAESLVKALQRNGVPHVYHLYKGEGHGWRKPETIEHFFGAIDAFLRQHVIFS
jgi:dipeptidyl aminopeptidase/acylaminoacyl peptidase